MNENRNFNDKIIQLEEKITDIKTEKKKLKNDLKNIENIQKTKNIDDYLKNELDKLRVKSEEDIKNQRIQMQEIHNNEIKLLSTRNDKLEEHNEKLETKLKIKEKQYEDLMGNYTILRSKLESECNELRSEIKVKSFELDRMNIYMKDTLNNNKKVMQDNLIITEKFELLKSEYNKLESEYNRINAELRAELTIKKEALSNYEEMENQIDKMINNPHNIDKLTSMLNNFPTKSNLRIKHAIKLAAKLNEQLIENEKLKQQIEEFRKTIIKLQGEHNVLKKVSNLSDKPFGNLTKELQKKEEEVLELYKALEDKNIELSKIKRELDSSNKLRDNMVKDFEEMKNKRKNLENIQNKIENLMKLNKKK